MVGDWGGGLGGGGGRVVQIKKKYVIRDKSNARIPFPILQHRMWPFCIPAAATAHTSHLKSLVILQVFSLVLLGQAFCCAFKI